MANAAIIAGPTGRAALNTAAGEVARQRGRQISPRSLWDAAAELSLSGLSLEHEDPCFTIADIAERGDEHVLIRALACNAAFAAPTNGSLLADLSRQDPGFRAGKRAHELISDAGLEPEGDARRFLEWLSADSVHPAVARAGKYLSHGRQADGQSFHRGRILARAAWLGGELATMSTLPRLFASALQAQESGEDPGTSDALYEALEFIEEGVAAVFGLSSGPEKYYPTDTPAPGAQAEILVEARLVSDRLLMAVRDPVLEHNPSGAALVGYRPLALSLLADGMPIHVDYPLWQLLDRAAAGAAPSAVDLERFLALRQAIRAVGVGAAADPRKPLLVRERGIAGRKFRVVSRTASGDKLRATEVV